MTGQAEWLLSPEQLAILDDADAGAFYLPEELGGLELNPVAFSVAIEALSARDAAVGWVAMVWATYSLFAGYVDDATAKEIWPLGASRTARISGTINPTGRARPVEGGFIVDGRWSFGSGCHHADWLIGNCIVDEEASSESPPGARIVMVPVSDAEIIHTWDVGGLRATGSDDFALRDCFVPTNRTIAAFSAPPTRPGSMFRGPFITLFAASVAAPQLGIARGAVEALIELASAKTPTGSASLLRDRPTVQAQVAQCVAQLDAARALLHQRLAELWATLEDGRDVTMQQRGQVRLAAAQCGAVATAVTETMYRLGGATSNYTSSRLEAALRDAYAASRHIAVSESNFELCGRVLFGLDPGTPRF